MRSFSVRCVTIALAIILAGSIGGYPLDANAQTSLTRPDSRPEAAVPTGPVVESFTLIDADTDLPIAGYDPIAPGELIDVSHLPTLNLNIRANTNPPIVGSVRFGWDGNHNYRTENFAPYSLAGDDNAADYRGFIPSAGVHMISATAFDGARATGAFGPIAELTFSLTGDFPNQPPVANAGADFTVVDGDNSGAEIVTLDGTGSGDPDGSVASYAWSEGGVPAASGASPALNLLVGTHTFDLVVTDNEGLSSTADQVVVTVVPPSPSLPAVIDFSLIDADADTAIAAFDPIPEGAVIDLDAIGTVHVTIRANTAPFQIGSVRFGYDDNPDVHVDNINPPYSISGDVGGDYNPMLPLTLGAHTIVGKPFSGKNASGTQGIHKSVSFEFTGAAQAPVVDAGAFQLVDFTLTQQVQMAPTVTDDGLPSPGSLIYRWRQVPTIPPAPASAVFSNRDTLFPTVTLPFPGLYTFELEVNDGLFIVKDQVQVLASLAIAVPGPLDSVPVPGPDNLAAFDPNLSSLVDSLPVPFSEFVVDKAAAIKLGKALFWDMQLGSDGVQACASCHFHAGVDNRFVNAVSPGLNGGDNTFQVGGPNSTLQPGDYPFHLLSNPDDRLSLVSRDFNDITGSQGVLGAQFNDVVPGSDQDDLTLISNDAPWNTGAFNTRRVEPRNTPTAINAAFNFRNFWDGRAFNNFNGVNPFGNRDPNARVVSDGDGAGGADAQAVSICVVLSSLASQAVGPPLSDFEMGSIGRSWPKLGKKMLALPVVLAKQMVDTTDSVLGSLSNAPAPGISGSYAAMIQAAFNPRWWNSDNVVTFGTDGIPVVGPPTGLPLTTDQYTLMEANFSMFFGLAVQCYEATLISDQAPFDAFRHGNLGAMSASAIRGMRIFTNIGLDPTIPAGLCINCHIGSEFTGAAVSNIARAEPPLPGEVVGAAELVVERMQAGLGVGFGTLILTTDPFNTPPDPGVTPQLLTFDPRGGAIEIRDANGTIFFSGTLPGIPGTFPPGPAPCVNEFATIALARHAAAGPLALADASYTVGADCVADFTVATNGLDMMPGTFTVFVDGQSKGTLQVLAPTIYDIGFYNLGVRPTTEDIGLGGTDPFGNPLSFSAMELLQPGRPDIRKGIPGGGLGGGNELNPPAGAFNEFAGVEGAFKVPTLRNVELTGPYFHNGGQATLRQVIDFYDRGGDFAEANLNMLDPDIVVLLLSEQDKQDLVAFLVALTDDRVRYESAPFDHPELMVPDGHNPVDGVTILATLPATGATGGAPIAPYLGLDPQTAMSTAAVVAGHRGGQDDIQVAGAANLPKQFELDQNYPNPFNPSTTIRFAVAQRVDIELAVYDVRGRKIRTLVNQATDPGVHSIEWDGRDSRGASVASGVYFYRLRTPNLTRTKKMMLVK